MAKASLSFAKIVATPTESAWAQAYNQGSVFVVLSLTKTEDIEPESLTTIGNEVLSIFRSEFFGLEDKSLPRLKEVVHKSFEHVPSSVLISFIMAFNKDDVVYLLLVGGGKAIMKRGEAIGVLLHDSTSVPKREIRSASGVLKSSDVIIIQTQEFAEKVPDTSLEEALSLELPNDMAETLAPGIHNSEQGGAAAIILAFHGVTPIEEGAMYEKAEEGTEEKEEAPNLASVSAPTPASTPAASAATIAASETTESAITHDDEEEDLLLEKKEQETDKIDEEEEDEEELPTHKSLQQENTSREDDRPIAQSNYEEPSQKKRLPLPSLPRRSKLLIGVVVVLVVLLVGGIVMTKRSEEQADSQALFEQVYKQASESYDIGMEIVAMNKPLANDNFIKARDELKKVDGKFEEGSEEQKKIDELEKKIDEQLGGGGASVPAKEISDTPPIFAAENETKDGLAFTEDDNFVYILSSKNVSSSDKGNDDTDTLITNDDNWTKPVAIGYYLGNIYVLDTQNGLLKFVQSGDNYAESTYFKDAEPSMNSAVSMAIDGSIYILQKDGSVQKYTKGVSDSFKTSGLPTPLTAPSKIYTTADIDGLYVMDPKAGRVVKLNKTGAYDSEVSSDAIKGAKDFFVNPEETEVFVLTNGKTYSIPLKQ